MSIINKNTVKQLQAELAAAKAEITRLKQQNASLLERLAHAFNAATPKKPASTLVSSPLIFPPLTFPSLTSGTSSKLPSLKIPLSFLVKWLLLAPSVSPLSIMAISSYTPLPLYRSTTLSLASTDYQHPAVSSTNLGFPYRDDYDPLDPSNLHNPIYDDWDEMSRTTAAHSLFLCRILHALDYLKAPVKQSVASFFANKGYIDRGNLLELFSVKKT
ncbi:hypothetical protein AB4K20DRAFT_1969898 [Rhizopus microsporus]|uniref:Uncharacterized protein n=1 Tax=Rhizopus microsporus TaxID=58291 RepID=A0A1X0S7W9_RHIZD|nr:hypothetical protein BCV71DRAFT_262124 [Rhizopus microsporus]